MKKENSPVATLFKKVSVDSAIDELLGSTASAAGVIGGSIAMKLATDKKINQWLVTGIGLLAGYGIRLVAKNETLKDVGTGLLIAGTLDGAKKILNKVAGKVAALDTINASIPQLSGPEEVAMPTGYIPSNLRGNYAEVQEVSSIRF